MIVEKIGKPIIFFDFSKLDQSVVKSNLEKLSTKYAYSVLVNLIIFKINSSLGNSINDKKYLIVTYKILTSKNVGKYVEFRCFIIT